MSFCGFKSILFWMVTSGDGKICMAVVIISADLVFLHLLDIGVSSAIINFNEGLAGLKRIFNKINLDFGFYSEGATKKDTDRMRHTKRKSTETFMTSRKMLRGIKKGFIDNEKQTGGGNHIVLEVFR